MKKQILCCILCVILLLLITGCSCEHQWQEASCVSPRTCTLCQEIQGAPIGHSWAAATCDAPKTCENCGATEGEARGHTWEDATCTVPKKCSLCHTTQGQPLNHSWLDATTEAPKTCENCNATEGSKIITDPRFTTASAQHLFGKWSCDVVLPGEMAGTTGYLDEVPCTIFMEFQNDGTLVGTIELHDQIAFMEAVKKYTKDLFYEMLAADGYSKSEADAIFIEIYGMDIDALVEQETASVDLEEIFADFFSEAAYYVTDAGLYIGESWKTEFEFQAYTIEDGVLIIKQAVLEEGGDPIEWIRVEE